MTPDTHPDGLLFGPTSSGKGYLSMYDHRGRNRDKSAWAEDLAPPEEYSIFSHADASDQCDSSGHYWGVRTPAGAILGTRGERLAKFPHNGVPAMPWHGYPVAPVSARASEVPPDDLIERLISAGAVSRTLGRKIQRRKT